MAVGTSPREASSGVGGLSPGRSPGVGSGRGGAPDLRGAAPARTRVAEEPVAFRFSLELSRGRSTTCATRLATRSSDALVETVNKAWTNLPVVNVLRAFEMRRDVADEMLREDGACPTEGKGRRGAHRAHTHPAYAALRTRLGIETNAR